MNNYPRALNNDNDASVPALKKQPQQGIDTYEFVKTGKFCDTEFSESGDKFIQINLSKLPGEKRQPAWKWLKQYMPHLADLIELQELQTVKQRFEGEVLVFMPESALIQLGIKS